MNRNLIYVMVITIALIGYGCSGNNSSPVFPTQPNSDLTGQNSIASGTSKAVWGVWEVSIDTTSWEVNLVPLRGIQYTVDVVTFLQKPAGNPANLSIAVKDVSKWMTEGLLGVDVGLRHPFPGLFQYTGFDVYGVFVTPGSLYSEYDPNVTWTNGTDEPKLLNADGYTRWMNPVEFPANGTIFRFVPGKLGTQNIGLFTSTINAYKYFADGLAKEQTLKDYYAQTSNTDNRGMFKPGSFNERKYDLKFPMVGGSPYLVFQYAVIASWVEPDKKLSGDPDALEVPGDFSLSANADEAIYIGIADKSTLYYNAGVGGGSLKLALEVYDWGASQSSSKVVDQIHQIIVEDLAGVLPSGYVQFDKAALASVASAGTSAISSVFEIEIAGCKPTSNNPVPLIIIVESESPDSFDPGTGTPGNSDRLAGYFLYDAPVGSTIPSSIKVISPNGGETLYMGMSYNITWNPGPGGIANVKIEWSTDNFVSDIKTITASTPNTGNFEWKPIPVVATTTAKVRITNVAGTESDTSDNNFTIALPVWLEFQDIYQVPYAANGYEFSPAITQTTAGMTFVMFYAWLQGGSNTYDACAYSTTGATWGVTNNFFGSGGSPGLPNLRADSAKIAPGHTGQAWGAIAFDIGILGYFYIAQVHTSLGNYTFDGLRARYKQGKYVELMTDSAGFLYIFADHDSASSISWRKSNQPGLTGYGGPGQMDSVQLLTSDGFVSHSRSWARQGQGLAFIYYTTTGQIILAETTDAPTNSTWDTTEVVWTPTGYTNVHNPALCADSTGRLFAIWTARETSSNEYQILASLRATPTSSWTTPVKVASATADIFDDIHITSSVVNLPGGVSKDVAVVAWETSNKVSVSLSPMDLMAFLPAQDVSPSGVTAIQPDVFCPGSPFNFKVLFAYSFDNAGNQDIALRTANFKTP